MTHFEAALATRTGSFTEHLAQLDRIAAGLEVDPGTGRVAPAEVRARASEKAGNMREVVALLVERRRERGAPTP